MAAGTLVQGALFTVMVVRAGMLRDREFGHELAAQVERSPRFFRNAPVVLDLKGADGFTEAADFVEARDRVARADADTGRRAERRAGAACGGDRGRAGEFRAERDDADSACPPRRLRDSPGCRFAAPAEPSPAPPPARAPTRIVTEPVRSGTQIYARGGDLIVTAAVSAGAEVMADGNIHVYGRLRGRALAGAAGDTAARIFCTRLEAELISIAGRYLVSEQLPAEYQGGPAQIALVDDGLTIIRS